MYEIRSTRNFISGTLIIFIFRSLIFPFIDLIKKIKNKNAQKYNEISDRSLI